ncbi:hypothetical protein RYH80_14715 [Halobaculum sp. MBLA0147]|uniref:DUF7344 domain-containing protein n=1 Tax=Halobaculum sp. MBLA0147 TaxID=3079934 RepID=UPI0035241B3C
MGQDRLDDDTVFALVSNRRRRLLIALLCACDGTVTIDDAAERVARAERGGESAPGTDESSEPTAQQVRSVYVSLYQTHVPRLSEHGVVAYDREGRTVRLRQSPATRRLLAVSGLLDRRPWWLYYLLTAAGVWTVLSAATLQTGLAGAVGPGSAVLVAAGALFAIVVLRRLAEPRWRVDDGRLRRFAPGLAARCRETGG